MKHKLTKAQKKQVRDWLELGGSDQHTRCPFQESKYPFYSEYCKNICEVWFPRCGYVCPCRIYTHDYVLRVAKRMVEY